MSRIYLSGTSKFIAGVIVGAVVLSGSAIAVNNYVSDNTPENGYLLCANMKTKAVTFPNKLSCPPGTKSLDMGAVTGVEGPQGPEGPQGFTGAQGPAGGARDRRATWLGGHLRCGCAGGWHGAHTDRGTGRGGRRLASRQRHAAAR